MKLQPVQSFGETVSGGVDAALNQPVMDGSDSILARFEGINDLRSGPMFTIVLAGGIRDVHEPAISMLLRRASSVGIVFT